VAWYSPTFFGESGKTNSASNIFPRRSPLAISSHTASRQRDVGAKLRDQILFAVMACASASDLC
jgi:hypothetical protein